MCVCVCVRERYIERERERACVRVCVYVSSSSHVSSSTYRRARLSVQKSKLGVRLRSGFTVGAHALGHLSQSAALRLHCCDIVPDA
jgi:hypothetical protein